MAEGWIKNWREDGNTFWNTYRADGSSAAKRAQANFRKNFRAKLFANANDQSPQLATLKWQDKVTLPNGLSDNPFTEAVLSTGETGFLPTSDVCEIAYVGTAAPTLASVKKTGKLRMSHGDVANLVWGDVVQIFDIDGQEVRVWARGLTGRMSRDDLQGEALLDIYFIDVGQGDGALIRFPDGQHMMIDGGQDRGRQMTGKNAADLVDWKFFKDYGDWKVRLDWMVASHSDADHYKGLSNLISKSPLARAELDCIDIAVTKFGHPGLSRFPAKVHHEKLGPLQDGYFTHLLGDRDSAVELTEGTAPDGLKISGGWKTMVKALLGDTGPTEFVRLSLDEVQAAAANLPNISDTPDYGIFVLGPVTEEKNGKTCLRDLGTTSFNTNGHSVCLRLDYGKARILMTGDLNTKSMDWLTEAFDDKMGEWKSDVAKACHHGSGDVSFPFLQEINAAATIISSGDNEGHAHPRPEIVSASALSGRTKFSDDGKFVITPLVYMTEIERSVLLAEVNRVDVANLEEPEDSHTLFAKPISEFSSSEFLSKSDWADIKTVERNNHLSKPQKKAAIKEIKKAAETSRKALYGTMSDDHAHRKVGATMYGKRPAGTIGMSYPMENLQRLRMLEKNRYGMVTVRTNGDIILCATKRDDGNNWLLNSFEAEGA